MSDMRKVRTRIAPSPTGFVHVGTAYVAVFNWAFAKKNGGEFVLRIEDTDVKRNVKSAYGQILDALKWLGLDWDEGPIKQSDRLEIYKKYSEKLVDGDKAYESDGAVFLKVVSEGVGWKDMVRGEIKFPADQLKDFVIMKSNGYPSYNFAVVVDDGEMKISHVIRAEDHISNTPRQILVYKALGFELPEFGHIPLLRNSDKSKISKRKNQVSLIWYMENGYLPEVLVNFLCLLGWSHPEGKEIFDINEFSEKLVIGDILTSGPVFNIDKLNWLNQQYIQNMNERNLGDVIFDFFEGKYDKKLIAKLIPLINTRISTLAEFEEICRFIFEKVEVDRGLFGEDYKEHLKSALGVLESLENWELNNINDVLGSEIKDKGFKTGKYYMDMRIAMAGSKITPPINESMVILGREEVVQRLRGILS